MICKTCIDGAHDECKGGTWCDCQHRVKPLTLEKVKEVLQRHFASLPDLSIDRMAAKESLWPTPEDET